MKTRKNLSIDQTPPLNGDPKRKSIVFDDEMNQFMDDLNDGYTVIADRKTLAKLAKLMKKGEAKKPEKEPSKDELNLIGKVLSEASNNPPPKADDDASMLVHDVTIDSAAGRLDRKDRENE